MQEVDQEVGQCAGAEEDLVEGAEEHQEAAEGLEIEVGELLGEDLEEVGLALVEVEEEVAIQILPGLLGLVGAGRSHVETGVQANGLLLLEIYPRYSHGRA